MNEIIEKMLSRHAIRRYQKRQLDEDTLEQILQAGLYAPSAGNNQRTLIVVCQDEEVNEKLGRLSRDVQFKDDDPKKIAMSISADQPSIKDDLSLKSSFYHAPTVLTIFAPQMKYTYEDAAMVAENIQLAAHFLGVGACYVGRTDEVFATEYGRNIRKEWGVPEEYLAVGNVILGYSAGPEPHVKPRKEGRIVRVKGK
jgi:nitroreductase